MVASAFQDSSAGRSGDLLMENSLADSMDSLDLLQKPAASNDLSHHSRANGNPVMEVRTQHAPYSLDYDYRGTN